MLIKISRFSCGAAGLDQMAGLTELRNANAKEHSFVKGRCKLSKIEE